MGSTSVWGYANPNGPKFQFQERQNNISIEVMNHVTQIVLVDPAGNDLLNFISTQIDVGPVPLRNFENPGRPFLDYSCKLLLQRSIRRAVSP